MTSVSSKSGGARRRTRLSAPLLFLGPFALLFVGMYIVPICFAIGQSLFKLKRSGLGLSAPTMEWDPTANYSKLLGDEPFREGLLRVLAFGVVQVPVMLGLALVLALLLDSRSARGVSFFRLGFFLPFAIPSVISAVMWSYLYSGTSSPINQALDSVVGVRIPFFSSGLTLWSVANIVTWVWTGYNMLIIYSSLKTIPAETLEAAKLDGASPLRIAWSIKIPMVRSAIILTTVFSIIGSAQLYNEPRVMQPISGGAISADYTPLMAAANSAQSAQNYPYAAAQSVTLALIVGVLSFIFLRLTSRKGDM